MQLPTSSNLMSTRDALQWLGLEVPKIKGASQADVDQQMATWKQDVLKAAYREKLKEHHPDHNPDDPEANISTQRVQEAYEKLKTLKVNFHKPVTSCPCCRTAREPATAHYCHECGRRYEHNSYDQMLMDIGLPAKDIDMMRQKDGYQRLRDANPLSPDFRMQVIRSSLFGGF